MIAISVQPSLRTVLPDFALGCISAGVVPERHNPALWREIDQRLRELTCEFKPDQINSIPQIAAMRAAYKALGKDPSRYRGSAEALLRRVVSGKGLYQINNVVDINNLISLGSLNPAGAYDLGRITTPIELRVGAAGETYKGIGKDEINIESLPVLADANGAFGSPTSDSERTMVRLETRKILMVVFSFTGPSGLESWMGRVGELLRKYAAGEEVEYSVAS